jgi:hypothetical protein
MNVCAYKLDDELTPDQKNDLSILISLKTDEEKNAWINSVDEYDFYYGLSLLEIGALKELERDTENVACNEAKSIIDYIMALR